MRQTAGYLPEASVAFIDEVFKANSAILNTLLTILNERLFDNGATRVRVPLVCLVRPSLFPSLLEDRGQCAKSLPPNPCHLYRSCHIAMLYRTLERQ